MAKLQQWSPPFADALGVFRLHCRAQRYSPATLTFYDRRLIPFGAWLAGQNVTDLAAVTANHLRAYLVARQDAGASPHYLHSIVRALRTFFGFCVTEEWLSQTPMRKVAPPRLPATPKPAFDEPAIRALLKAAATDRDRAVVYVLLDTGLRAAELVALRGGDVDASTGAVSVRHGKGDKARTVYLGAKTLRVLLRYYMQRGAPGPEDPIWVADRRPHAPLTYFGLAQLLRRLGAAAGVPDCTAHRFRRTFALQCLRNGMDLYSLQRLMGHADISVLRHYLALAQADVAAAYRRFGVVDNL